MSRPTAGDWIDRARSSLEITAEIINNQPNPTPIEASKIATGIAVAQVVATLAIAEGLLEIRAEIESIGHARSLQGGKL